MKRGIVRIVIVAASIAALAGCVGPNRTGGPVKSSDSDASSARPSTGTELAQQERDLRRALAGTGNEVLNTGDRLIVRMPQDRLFSSGGADLSGSGRADLARIADSLANYPASAVQVVSHTDSDGDADSNLRRSQTQASLVRDFFVQAGLSAARVQPIGRGESQPLASNLSDAGKAQNRRTEIVILPTVI